MAGRGSQAAMPTSLAATGSKGQDLANGQPHTSDNASVSTAGQSSKKAKNKKAPDVNEVGKALAAKINQLELDAAEEKDQELEIEREVKKATRDLTNLLNQMDNPMSKLDTLQKKYSELLSDMRRMDRENTKNKKRADLYQKEKDQGRSQLSKTDAVKAKLESVCRELQRENKKLKDDQKRIESDEKSVREELSDRADTLFWELNESMNRTEQPAPIVPQQNAEIDELFRQRFKSFIEQYELRELHVISLMRMKDSEVRVNIARAEEQRQKAETEANKSRTLSTQVSTFSQTETELRSQLNIYVEKFKQVEDTLNNSNDLFLTFRKEMEEMSKKTKRLEKENLNLNRKHDLTNRNILEMAEERTKVNKEAETLRKKNQTLESLVRRMQDQGRIASGTSTGTSAAARTTNGSHGQVPSTKHSNNVEAEGHLDDEGTESEYDDDELEDEEYEEAEGDEDVEGELLDEDDEDVVDMHAPVYGPEVPPPPPPPTTSGSGVKAKQQQTQRPKFNGAAGTGASVNGVAAAIAQKS